MYDALIQKSRKAAVRSATKPVALRNRRREAHFPRWRPLRSDQRRNDRSAVQLQFVNTQL